MILNKYLANRLFQNRGGTVFKIQSAKIYNRGLIGNRDWVGFGKNGAANYVDDIEVPFPAIRFKENTNELLALREKEKGDWRKLTTDEKKTLYRTSFRQTIIETLAPTGEWKQAIAGAFFFLSIPFWVYFLIHKFIYPDLPPTFDEKYKAATLRRMLDLKQGHLTGVSSKWDYDKEDWKK